MTKKSSKYYWITAGVIFILVLLFGSEDDRSSIIAYGILGGIFGGAAEILRKIKGYYDKKHIINNNHKRDK